MNICVRYFASIKDDMGMGTVNIQVDDDITAGNLFDQLTSEIQYNCLLYTSPSPRDNR